MYTDEMKKLNKNRVNDIKFPKVKIPTGKVLSNKLPLILRGR